MTDGQVLAQGPVLPVGVGFRLAVPPGWHELPLDPAHRKSGLQALLARVRDLPELREHRAAVAKLLAEQVRRAWTSGASYAASMLEPTEDGPITASVVVQVVPGPLGVPQAQLLGALAELLPPVPHTREGAPWRETTTVQVPTTSGGSVEAVRSVGVDDVDLPDERLGQGNAVLGTMRLVLLPLLAPLLHGRGTPYRVLASNTCVVSPTIPLPGLGIAVRYTDRDVAQVLADLPAILADGAGGPAAPSA